MYKKSLYSPAREGAGDNYISAGNIQNNKQNDPVTCAFPLCNAATLHLE